MKVKYLGTLVAASVLSLGLVTSCATPDSGGTNTGDDATQTAPADGTANPCAGTAKPDADK